MARRIIAVEAKPKQACPFVHHHGGKPSCQTCKRAFTPFELREATEACNGHVSCEEGTHIPRICEGCAAREEEQEAGHG